MSELFYQEIEPYLRPVSVEQIYPLEKISIFEKTPKFMEDGVKSLMYFLKGKYYYHIEKDIKKAEIYMNYSLDSNPEFSSPYFYLALFSKTENQNNTSSTQNQSHYFNLCLQKQPSHYHQIAHIKLALMQGNSYLQQGKFNQAKQLDPQDNLIFQQPQYRKYLEDYEWGCVLYHYYQNDTAIDHMNDLIEKNNQNHNYYFFKGKIQFFQKQYQEAIQSFDKTLELFPNHAGSFSFKAMSLAKQKNLNQAIAFAYLSIHLEPQNSSHLYRLGLLHYEQKMYNEAFKNFNLSIKFDPEFSFSHLYMGKVLQKQNKHKDAVQSFKTALSLCEDHIEIYFNIGASYFINKQYQKALECYEQGLQKCPGNLRAHQDVGLIYYKLNRKRQAINKFVYAALQDKRNLSYLNKIDQQISNHVIKVVHIKLQKEAMYKRLAVQYNELMNTQLWKKLLRKDINIEISEFLLQKPQISLK